ncbi:MAG: filamentous hemagglutinin N-terminal domain-containing protein [Phycisphaerales bacterium]|nr:filamentous hemagglutinin N-terminal domain-containing protein [Phycisphaerales bacterium]
MMKMRSFLTCGLAMLRQARLLAVATAMGWIASVSMAIPNGHTVVYGDVTIQYFSNYMMVTSTSGKSIIDWSSFNLGQNESIQFLLPSSSSRILNRINGANGMSIINGVISSNGHVYLVNPAGITFGSNSVLNATRIYAAAGAMSNSDFLSGTDRFTDLTGTIINNGSIQAGEVHFAANTIVNTGDITGNLMSFSIGDKVYIQRVGDGIAIQIDGQDLGDPGAGTVGATLSGQAGIYNSGTITAPNTNGAGSIHLAAGDMYGLAILNEGTVQAAGGDISMTAQGGAIHNAENGVINVSSNNSDDGGNVFIQAPAFVNEGRIEANATSGNPAVSAGTIDINTYHNAIFTQTSNLQANANLAGSGGTISVEATNGTVSFAEGGTVAAKGGLMGGDGGTVDVSGQQVSYYATTKVGALNGTDGSLSVSVDESVDVFAPGGVIIIPSIVDLGSAIDVTSRVGTNVLNNFDGDVSISSNNDVSLNQGFDLQGHDLSLSAGRNVNIHAEATGLNNFMVEGGERIVLGSSFTDIAGNATFISPDITVSGSSPVSIATGGNQLWDGAVRLNTDLDIAAAEATFEGSINGNYAFETDVANGLQLNGNLGDIESLARIDLSADLITFGEFCELIRADGDILLNADGRDALPEAATIVGLADALTIESTNGDIRMGQHEVFTQMGDLTLEAYSGTITLGDLNTYGDMFVGAPNIELLNHAGGNILLPDGTLIFLPGVHYLATGTITFTTTPIVLGDGVNPIFASGEFSIDEGEGGTLAGFDWIQNPDVDIDDFTFGDTVLNVHPGENTAANNDGGDVDTLAGDVAAFPTDLAAAEQVGLFEDEIGDVDESTIEGPLTLVSLADLGIDIEQIAESDQDLQGAISRTDVLANYPGANINPESGNILVKQRRLKDSVVQQALQNYQDVLAQQPGDTLVNINENNTAPMANSIQSSWATYAEANGDAATPAGFQAFLGQNEGQTATQAYVDGLQNVFGDLARSGLSTGEVSQARDLTAQRILESGTGGGLTATQFSQILQ